MAENKKYSLVTAALLYVMLCYVYFTMHLSMTDVVIALIALGFFVGTGLFVVGIYFCLKSEKKLILHVSAAYSALGAFAYGVVRFVLSLDDYLYDYVDSIEVVLACLCFILCVLVAAAFYILGTMTLKSEAPKSFRAGLLPVAAFSVMLAGTDCLGRYIDDYGVDYFPEIISFVQWGISWFTLAAIVVGLGYYYLCCRGKVSGKTTLIALIVCAVLSVCSICLNCMRSGFCIEGIIFMLGEMLAYFALWAGCIYVMWKNAAFNVPPATAAAKSAKDPLEALSDLNKLRQAGILTEEEYQEQKNKILGDK